MRRVFEGIMFCIRGGYLYKIPSMNGFLYIHHDLIKQVLLPIDYSLFYKMQNDLEEFQEKSHSSYKHLMK